MGKGVYSGGSTKIALSADGTVWPTSADDPGVAASDLRRAPAQRRWSGKLPDDPPSRMAPRSELNHLVLCARAFLKDQLSQRIPQPPAGLADFVASYGGNICWLEASPQHKQRFVEAINTARKRAATVKTPPPALAPPKKGKQPKRAKTAKPRDPRR